MYMYDELIAKLRYLARVYSVCDHENTQEYKLAVQAADAIEELSKPKWIPVKSRPMDEEERAEWSVRIGYDIEYEDAIIYTSQLPDDGEEVLTCDRYGNVRLDTFSNDPEFGCFFEDNGDMDGITAWMPKPKPYEPPKEE